MCLRSCELGGLCVSSCLLEVLLTLHMATWQAVQSRPGIGLMTSVSSESGRGIRRQHLQRGAGCGKVVWLAEHGVPQSPPLRDRCVHMGLETWFV